MENFSPILIMNGIITQESNYLPQKFNQFPPHPPGIMRMRSGVIDYKRLFHSEAFGINACVSLLIVGEKTLVTTACDVALDATSDRRMNVSSLL
ncbi:hypothetical protein CDAR_617401 [Caerostris darwini]|uniref:Uncharacterized protein n=1 Tax=Caerostris darwini TaxID=1538125 RepID=A0AAV4SWK5_9ARAC|nr:hypothetical protein CDAR_617401 [Caerostris darwini]